MILRTGIHPIAENFSKSYECKKPINITEFLGEVQSSRFPQLEHLIQEAFQDIGFALKQETVTRLRFYQVGLFSYVFVADIPEEPFDKGIVMQLSKGSENSIEGRTVDRDSDNLRYLNSVMELPYLPRVLGKNGRVAIQGMDGIIATFTEFLDDYHELNFYFFSNPVKIYTNRPENELQKFSLQESSDIMVDMVKIMSYIFSKTYDHSTEQGMLITDIMMNAGDFLYNSRRDKRPRVKLITARELVKATPAEFLFYMMSPLNLESKLFMRPKPSAFRINSYQGPMADLMDGIFKGIQEAGYEKPEVMFKAWIDYYGSNLQADLSAIDEGICKKTIKSFEEIRAGYRSYLKIESLRAFSESEQGRHIGIDDPMSVEFAFPILAQKRDWILSKLFPRMISFDLKDYPILT